MAERRGCFRNGCFGCLGLLVLVVLFVGANALIVANRDDGQRVEDLVLDSAASVAPAPGAKAKAGRPDAEKPPAGVGWLVLELGQGEFRLHPGEPGSGVVVRASYDTGVYDLQEFSHVWPDSAWVYEVRFHRTMSGLQAVLRELMGDGGSAEVHIFIPPDLPVELNVLVKEGGLEAELGGLWLTGLDLRYVKGGVSLHLDQPLRQPLESVAIHGRMGGAEIQGLGHASPRRLEVSCAMGGMSLGLAGAWQNDCDARLSLSMGGMEVVVPDNIEREDVGADPGGLRRSDRETLRPVLRLGQQVKMGEIEVR